MSTAYIDAAPAARAAPPAAPPFPGGIGARLRWHWRHDAKLEVRIAWWTMAIFYQLFGIVFFAVTRVMPPPKPWWNDAQVAAWFVQRHDGLTIGFGVIFLIAGLCAMGNALIAYSMFRMSVSRVFAWSYIAIYSASTLPGMLLCGILMVVGAMRPDRDPALLHWLYDAANLTYNGTMGVFVVGTAVWMIAILNDRNGVFPRWFGYMQICNAITEFVVAPCWIMRRGPFAWNGVVAFWIDAIVWVFYTIVFFMMLKTLTRDDAARAPAAPSPFLVRRA